jgi:hypothetical protein
VRLKGLGQSKNPMTSPGTELATFWLGAQGLNQLSYCMSPELLDVDVKFSCHISLRVFKVTMSWESSPCGLSASELW